jgi:hypothetical protein
MNYEKTVHKGVINADTLAEHENLLDQYQALDVTLQDLRSEFEQFLSHAI